MIKRYLQVPSTRWFFSVWISKLNGLQTIFAASLIINWSNFYRLERPTCKVFFLRIATNPSAILMTKSKLMSDPWWPLILWFKASFFWRRWHACWNRVYNYLCLLVNCYNISCKIRFRKKQSYPRNVPASTAEPLETEQLLFVWEFLSDPVTGIWCPRIPVLICIDYVGTSGVFHFNAINTGMIIADTNFSNGTFNMSSC